jgi:hypothetical protein
VTIDDVSSSLLEALKSHFNSACQKTASSTTPQFSVAQKSGMLTKLADRLIKRQKKVLGELKYEFLAESIRSVDDVPGLQVSPIWGLRQHVSILVYLQLGLTKLQDNSEVLTSRFAVPFVFTFCSTN